MAETDEVTVTMALQDGYRFLVDFQQEGVPGLLLDEPEPLGEGRGPNAARVLAAAVGNCLSASALFCLRKARVDVRGMRTTAQASAACGPPRRPPWCEPGGGGCGWVRSGFGSALRWVVVAPLLMACQPTPHCDNKKFP